MTIIYLPPTLVFLIYLLFLFKFIKLLLLFFFKFLGTTCDDVDKNSNTKPYDDVDKNSNT